MKEIVKVALVVLAVVFGVLSLVGLAMATLFIPAQFHPCTSFFWNLSDNQIWQLLGVLIAIIGCIGLSVTVLYFVSTGPGWSEEGGKI